MDPFKRYNIPKELRICGKLYKIIIDDTMGTGGEFICARQTIKIGGKKISAERQLDALMHEVIEIIFVERDVRYQLGYDSVDSGDFLFNFDHKEWEHIAGDIAEVVRQIYERMDSKRKK